jgi:hypothetical protein
MMKDVSFAPVEGAINDRIDDAYKAKYAKSAYLGPMIGVRMHGVTIRILPR